MAECLILLEKVLTPWEYTRIFIPVVGITSKRPRAHYDVARIVADMTMRGWNNSDLARAANVSGITITRFLRGEHQTAKTAERIARALGHTVRRYLSRVEAVA